MRHFFLFFILLFLYTSLNAVEYIRSIRVSSLPNKPAAEEAMVDVEKFLYSHEEFLKLYQENQFDLKIITAGKYYLLVLEPFTDRKTMQTILDIVRQRHPGAYPKKLLSYDFAKLHKHKGENGIQKQIEPVVQTQPVALDTKEVKKNQRAQQGPKAVEKKESKVVQTAAKPMEKKWFEKYDINVLIIAILTFTGLLLLLLIFFIIKTVKLKQKNAILQSMVEHTTEELDSKERLMAHVSHELRTPMTAISGLSHIILENELPSFQRENVQNIENSVNKAIEIINDILDVTKINAGKMRIENRKFNLNSVLEHVLNTVYIQAKNNNVSLNLDVNDNVPVELVSDSLRLGQILINLLTNAIKFTKNGEVSLQIEKKETYADSVKLEFKVSDTGIGMTKEEMNKIFTAYVQANALTSREFGGTGLGLVISKELIENMDGKIKVHSEKGVGTTFAFTIVIKVNDIENKRHYHLPSRDLLNKNILIVESSNKNVIALLRAFRYFKYKTHVTPSLTEDFTEKSMEFDLIVINQMNLSSEAIKKLQKMHFNNRTKTKIILTSERYSILDKEILQELDIAGFLKIPFTQQSVFNVLVEIYGMKKTKDISQTNIIKEKLTAMKGKKILIAEDNILNHKVLLGLMSKTGIELTFVINGQDVVDLLKKDGAYDLILMDIEMPVINGFDATKEIRKNPQYNSIPILGLSANITQKAVDKAFASGMQGYISKPIVVDVFYKKIYDALAHEIKLSSNMKIQSSNEESVELSVIMGLGRCNNDKILYKNILEDFKKIYISSSTILQDLCENNDFKQAKRIIMDIKDVALNIGAYHLLEKLDTLQHEIEYGKKGNWEEGIVEYSEILNRLLEQIDAYLERE